MGSIYFIAGDKMSGQQVRSQSVRRKRIFHRLVRFLRLGESKGGPIPEICGDHWQSKQGYTSISIPQRNNPTVVPLLSTIPEMAQTSSEIVLLS